ncbi:MAG TPA: lipoprotein [Variovorax sp.]|jgi:predicted small lipoprotein YifL|nr:lipoprotein [Variovorax sp.]
MLKVRQILVSVLGLCVLGVALGGCGQKGPLYFPTDPAAANRATLPAVLKAPFSRTDASAAPPAPTTPAPIAIPESFTTPALPLSDYETTR